MSESNQAIHRPLLLRWMGAAGLGLLWLIALGCGAWCLGALAYDFPIAKGAASGGFGIALLVSAFRFHGQGRKLCGIFFPFLLVLAWWLSLRPKDHANWQPDVAQLAHADIQGDIVTLSNVRNCDYRTELDYTPRWETRTVRLSHLTGIDLALTYWGSPWMAHPMLSFTFDDGPPLCFSIETRKETGESYSAIGGLYRQYELIYVVADERDVIRLRTNYRQGEEVYLYHSTLTPALARERFMEYLAALNSLSNQPRWYNAITTNCTTAIRAQRAPSLRNAWDWRMLINGKIDEMLFEQGFLATNGLPFPALKQQALINPKAKAADQSPDFSAAIRANLPR